MALLWGLWRRSGHRHLRGFSTTHFLIRYLFIVLCPVLLWIVFGDDDPRDGRRHAAHSAGPAAAGLSGQPHPARTGRAGSAGRRRISKWPIIVCQQIEMVLGVFALVGLISGADSRCQPRLSDGSDPPADRALAAGAAGASWPAWCSGVAHWARLFGQRRPPQPLDDDRRPPAAPQGPGPRFGSEKF